MQRYTNDLVKVQLMVQKSLASYPGRSSDYFVAVTGPGRQLGNDDPAIAPRCKQVTSNIWIKEIWLPKYTSIHFKYLVVKTSTNSTIDVEDIEPHREFVGQKEILIESTYNKRKEYVPTQDKFDNHEVKRDATEKRQQEKRKLINEWEEEYEQLKILERKLKELEDRYGKITELDGDGRRLQDMKEESRLLRQLENESKKLKIMEKESINLKAVKIDKTNLKDVNKNLKEESRKLNEFECKQGKWHSMKEKCRKLKTLEEKYRMPKVPEEERRKRNVLEEECRKMKSLNEDSNRMKKRDKGKRKLKILEENCRKFKTREENSKMLKILEKDDIRLSQEQDGCKLMEQDNNDDKHVSMFAKLRPATIQVDTKTKCKAHEENTKDIAGKAKLQGEDMQAGSIETKATTSTYFSCGGNKLIIVATGIAVASCIGLFAYFRK